MMRSSSRTEYEKAYGDTEEPEGEEEEEGGSMTVEPVKAEVRHVLVNPINLSLLSVQSDSAATHLPVLSATRSTSASDSSLEGKLDYRSSRDSTIPATGCSGCFSRLVPSFLIFLVGSCTGGGVVRYKLEEVIRDAEHPYPLVLSGWQNIGTGMCRDDTCSVRASCRNTLVYHSNCAASRLACLQQCNGCAGVAWAENPVTFLGFCRDHGLGGCFVYRGSSSPVTTTIGHKDFVCYRPEAQMTELLLDSKPADPPRPKDIYCQGKWSSEVPCDFAPFHPRKALRVQLGEEQRARPRRDPIRRWAYVMLSYDSPGSVEHLWGVIAIASALQKLSSKYPLVLLTNTTMFPDGTSVPKAFGSLNVQILPAYKVEMPAQLKEAVLYQHWMIAYWKLQVWNLTQFEKLIWLDGDSIIYRNIDWLFERHWMWAQRDDWFCKMNVDKVCSGIMLLYPNASDYNGLLEYAEEVGDLQGGDQQLISRYFAIKRGLPINLLSDLEAAFGLCLGTAPSPYLNPDGSSVSGVWDIPSFVHKSGGWGNTNANTYNNACFMPHIARQQYVVGNTTLNMCQYHPLGPYWRSLFCDAIARVGIHLREIRAFCNDECWYQGRPPQEWSDDETGMKARDWHLCGFISGTPSSADYYSRTVGRPPSPT